MREPVSSARHSDLPIIAFDVLARVRERVPRVHCITNAVAQAFTANMLLAAGAIPSMTIAPAEVGDFIARTQAVLINLGTFDPERAEAAELAIKASKAAGLPWVLDPVFVDRSIQRATLARKLASGEPAAIRLNRAEFQALVDASSQPEVVIDHARKSGTVVALTGPTDLVTDGSRTVQIENGSPLMAKVTAMGDALSALVAACLAVEPDAWRAVASAVLIFGVAGEVAARGAKGPGSFATAFIDTIYMLDRSTLIATGRAR